MAHPICRVRPATRIQLTVKVIRPSREELEKLILAKVSEKGLGDINKSSSEAIADITEALT